MLDQKLIAAIAEKNTVLMCIEESGDEEAEYAARLRTFLQNHGRNVIMMQISDFKRSTPLLSAPPHDTLGIASSPEVATLMTATGILTLGISPETSFEGAAYVLPDMRSLYSFMGWILSSRRERPDEYPTVEKKVTAIIPAAGKGTRLGFDKPKILYPFGDITALDIMYAKVAPFSDRIIFVVSGEGEAAIREYLHRQGLRAEVLVDPHPHGTGGSVAVALEALTGTESALVIWGDQIGVPPEALRNIISLHHAHAADLSLPSRFRKKPYIHLERNERGRVVKVLRRRFNDKMPAYGENELGVFVLKGELLKSLLQEMKEKYWEERRILEERGEKPGEFDFLEIIPEVASRNYSILTSPFVYEGGPLGFNTLEEANAHLARL